MKMKIILASLIFSCLIAQSCSVDEELKGEAKKLAFTTWEKADQYDASSHSKQEIEIHLGKNLDKYNIFNRNTKVDMSPERINETMNFVKTNSPQFITILGGSFLFEMTQKYNLNLSQQYAIASILGNTVRINAKYFLMDLYINNENNIIINPNFDYRDVSKNIRKI